MGFEESGRHEVAQVAELAEVLCTSEDPGHLLRAVQEYGDVCTSIVGPGGEAATQLSTGVAISPEDAARCTLDLMRTTRFVRGIVRAMEGASQRIHSRPVRVLYAGCGPFAPLAILPMIRTPQIDQRWALVDVHPSAARSVVELTRRWGLCRHLEGVGVADATRLRIDRPAFDIVVAEVMQRSLAKEPQVAVMASLSPALANGGVMIPSAVELRLALADLGREFAVDDGDAATIRPRIRQDLGRVLRVDATKARELWSEGVEEVELETVEVPALTRAGLLPILRTTVEIHGPERLDDYESGLTVPEVLGSLGVLEAGDRIRAVYRMGSTPGVELWKEERES